MEKTIYKYRDMIKNELIISQGDIFCNLPYLTYDHLIRSSPNILDKFQNERDEIFTKILQNGGQVQVEGFIDAHWGILASQDCDIRSKKDLIFFPLEPTKTLYKSQNILTAIDENIKNTTRKLYLPRISPPNRNKTYGPFEIIFHNPFNIPYNLIYKNLKNCWIARIIDPARKIFIGKLSHFYSRIPIEEIIFLENKEITKYFIKSWKNFWGSKEDQEDRFQAIITRIKQVKDILKLVKREQDLNDLFYFDIELLNNIKSFLACILWYENAEELMSKCNQVKENIEKDPDFANSIFKEIINEFIIQDDCFMNNWEEFFKTNEIEIKRIRKDKEKILGIFPDDLLETKKDYINYANDSLKTKNLLDKFPSCLKEYSQLFNRS